MRQQMNTLRDLRNWVWEHMDAYTTPEDIFRITTTIQGDSKRPDWGEDWADYFAQLPENLGELIGMVGDRQI